MVVSPHAVGIDIGGTAMKIALVRADGSIACNTQIPTHVAAGAAAAVPRIVAAVRALGREAGLAPEALQAAGIASAGIIDFENQLVLDAPNLRVWERHPLAQEVGRGLGVPFRLENDVNAMAYGEWRCGAGRGARHLLCVTLGTGVGGGLVLDGTLYRGACGAAGEVGHITVNRDGPACRCGSTGCLERYVGSRYIVERAAHFLQRDARPSVLRGMAPVDISARRIATAAGDGDALARAVLAETGQWLGVGLASLANVLNPERIVVGGGVAAAGDWILEPARTTLRQRAMSIPGTAARVVPAALGNHAAVVGAALLALARVEEERA
jgi:glucokinase